MYRLVPLPFSPAVSCATSFPAAFIVPSFTLTLHKMFAIEFDIVFDSISASRKQESDDGRHAKESLYVFPR